MCLTSKQRISSTLLHQALSGFALVILLLFISACGKVSIQVREIASVGNLPDFEKTKIIDSGAVPADGVTSLVLAVHLKNSNNTPVPNYQPTYEVTSGSGVIKSNCTSSDVNGISSCVLRSTQSGTKTLRLTNAKVGLQHDVSFSPPAGKGKILGLTSGSLQHGTSSDGYNALISTGSVFKGISVSTDSGYKGRISVQGASLPR